MAKPDPDRAIEAPADRPCATCPYRRDAPSGLWDRDTYELLPPYDGETGHQPPHVFMCHTRPVKLCAGWVGVHDPIHTLGLRLALSFGRMSVEVMEACVAYKTKVPLFGSGTEARDHGVRDIDHPGDEAVAAMLKIYRARRSWPHYECPQCWAVSWDDEDVKNERCRHCERAGT